MIKAELVRLLDDVIAVLRRVNECWKNRNGRTDEPSNASTKQTPIERNTEMAAVEVTISGMLYDKINRTTQNVVLIGEATLTGLGVGGGPIIPPEQKPPGIPGHPAHPIWGAPVDPGYGVPGRPIDPGAHPEHPILLPGMPGWPSDPPPQVPPPGSPPVALPMPGPVAPIVPPPAIIVDYPGVGKVLVPLPASAAPTPAKK